MKKKIPTFGTGSAVILTALAVNILVELRNSSTKRIKRRCHTTRKNCNDFIYYYYYFFFARKVSEEST